MFLKVGEIRIFVDNNTKSVVKDLYFTYEGYKWKDPRIKKVVAGFGNSAGINTSGIEAETSLMMYHLDASGNKHEYKIYERLFAGENREILVKINNINEDGSFEISIDTEYDHTR